MSRALKRHHRERLIERVKGFSEWYAERANRLYDTRKFCTCPVRGCGNPRRLLRGQRWLTPQERRQDERARYERKTEGCLPVELMEGESEGEIETLTPIEELLKPLVSLSAWQVVAGGRAGSLFGLDFGEKIPAKSWRKNREPPYPFRGEWYLYIACCWRLDEAELRSDPVTAWQESNEPDGPMLRGLHSLIGDPIRSLSIAPPAGDLTVAFESGRRLVAFCDQTWRGAWGGEGDGLSSNWSLSMPQRKALCVGPGYRWIYTDVDFPLIDLSPEDDLWQSTFELSCQVI